MTICTHIHAIPLCGKTLDGGWTHDFNQDDNLYMPIVAVTDEPTGGLPFTHQSWPL